METNAVPLTSLFPVAGDSFIHRQTQWGAKCEGRRGPGRESEVASEQQYKPQAAEIPGPVLF